MPNAPSPMFTSDADTLVIGPGSQLVLQGANQRDVLVSGTGAYLALYNGGFLSGVGIEDNGALFADPGVGFVDLLVSGGGALLNGDTVSGAVIGGGGFLIAHGGSVASATIAQGGLLSAYSGAVLGDLTVSGAVFVNDHVTLTGSNRVFGEIFDADAQPLPDVQGIQLPGLQLLQGAVEVFRSGYVDGLTVGSQGSLTVDSGGYSVSTFVSSGGIEIVSSGGFAAFVEDGPSQVVSSPAWNGSESFTSTHVVGGGGHVEVYAGGVVSGIDIGSGSVLSLHNGATVLDIDAQLGAVIDFVGVAAPLVLHDHSNVWFLGAPGSTQYTGLSFKEGDQYTEVQTPFSLSASADGNGGTLLTFLSSGFFAGTLSAHVASGGTVEVPYTDILSATNMSGAAVASVSAPAGAGSIALESIDQAVAFTPGSGFQGSSVVAGYVLSNAQGQTASGFIDIDILPNLLSAGPTISIPDPYGTVADAPFVVLSNGIYQGYPTALVISGASLDPASQAAGTLVVDQARNVLEFTATSGFLGTAVAHVSIANGYGGSAVQEVDFDVYPAASPNPAPTSAYTTQAQDGDVTITMSYSSSGQLLGTERTHVAGGVTVIVDYDPAGRQVSSELISHPTDQNTITQYFGSSWNQVSATILLHEPDGATVFQAFDGAWNQISATIDTQTPGVKIHEVFDGAWTRLSATLVSDSGNGVTTTQYFDGGWRQTSATQVKVQGDGSVITQHFDSAWNMLDAVSFSHTGPHQTLTQTYDSHWAVTGAEYITVNGAITYDQTYDAHWNLLGTIETIQVNSGGVATRVETHDGYSYLQSAIDTMTDGSNRYYEYSKPWSQLTFSGSADHSTTFVISAGQAQGDVFAGLHTTNLGGSLHDVINFAGYGAGGQVRQLDASHWQVSATGKTAEVFTLQGGASPGQYDYTFTSGG